MTLQIAQEQDLPVADYVEVLSETSLGAGRPLKNAERIQAMIRGANFILVARDETGAPVGLARCMSDGAWVCYCMDLAVKQSRQGEGIGRKLVETAKTMLGPKMGFILAAEPAAASFYRQIGMAEYSAFFLTREDAS